MTQYYSEYEYDCLLVSWLLLMIVGYSLCLNCNIRSHLLYMIVDNLLIHCQISDNYCLLCGINGHLLIINDIMTMMTKIIPNCILKSIIDLMKIIN